MTNEALVRLVDGLEDAAEGYVTLERVQHAWGHPVDAAVAQAILLIDHRTRVDGSAVTVCRLNRHHPLVQRLTAW